MTDLRVTCPKCGSDLLTHSARYIVRSPVTKWERNESGDPEPTDFGDDEIVSDSCEGVDYPYDCKGCGECDMSETDLIYDGKPHPDAAGGEAADA